jgi:16S rRNA processing protein RimM
MVGEASASQRPAEGQTPWVEVGTVARAHGLKGALLLLLHSDDPANLLAAGRLRLSGAAGDAEFALRSAEPAGAAGNGRARVRVRLEGIEGRDSAERWRGAGVGIPESALRALPEGEYYWRDLIGATCRTLGGRELGAVEEIWPTGSNDVLVVRRGEAQVLIPALHDVLVRLDLEARVLWIDPPDGLLEDS